MATITARMRRDGTYGHTAYIRIKKNKRLLHEEAKTFSSLNAAREWAKRREVELEDPKALLRACAPSTALKDLFRWYIESFRDIGKWGRTKQTTLEFLERQPISEEDALQLTAPMLLAHVRERRASGAGPATAGNDLTWIGCVLRAAASVKSLPVRPEIVDTARAACRELRLTAKSRQRDRTPTYHELVALDAYFERAEKRRRQRLPMRHILWFAIYSARRQEEITKLRRSDNDSDRQQGVVRDAKHPTEKEGNHRRFRYTPQAWAIAEMQPIRRQEDRIFPFNPKSIGARFHRACRLLGIEDLRFHDLRHESTTRLFERGLTIPDVAAHTLHESWGVLKRYTHLLKRGKVFEAPFLTPPTAAVGRSIRQGPKRLRAIGSSAHQVEMLDTGESLRALDVSPRRH